MLMLKFSLIFHSYIDNPFIIADTVKYYNYLHNSNLLSLFDPESTLTLTINLC